MGQLFGASQMASPNFGPATSPANLPIQGANEAQRRGTEMEKSDFVQISSISVRLEVNQFLESKNRSDIV